MSTHSGCIAYAIVGFILLANSSFADSVTISETWKDSVDVHGSLTTKDTGTLNASLTIPGMSGMTANDWSNLVVTINMTPYQGSQFINDVMADAPNTGGSITFRLDTLHLAHETVHLTLRLRAVGSYLEVRQAELPRNSDQSASSTAWTTMQIGGDVVYRGGGGVR